MSTTLNVILVIGSLTVAFASAALAWFLKRQAKGVSSAPRGLEVQRIVSVDDGKRVVFYIANRSRRVMHDVRAEVVIGNPPEGNRLVQLSPGPFRVLSREDQGRRAVLAIGTIDPGTSLGPVVVESAAPSDETTIVLLPSPSE